MNCKWDQRFIYLAKHIASWSKDPSTQCGAVITDEKQIISLGFNGFPAGTNDSNAIYADRERKYKRVLHAEQNALLFAQSGVAGCTCYVWPMPPCSTCAAMLIQAGITRVVSVDPSKEQCERWGDHWSESEKMFQEADVVLEYQIMP